MEVRRAPKIVTLDRGNNTNVTVNLHGATITSWRIQNHEQLFMSRYAIFDGTRSIRGGINFVFPQYGPWTFGPQHGFARLVTWKVEQEPKQLSDTRDIEAVFSTTDDEYTRSMWNFQFLIKLKMTLHERQLDLNLTIHNPSPKRISCKILFHTYFKVPDVRLCEIRGLKGALAFDIIQNADVDVGEKATVKIRELTDKYYKNTKNEHEISNMILNAKMKIKKTNLPDTVVWNPWERAALFPDMGENEYLYMLSVESGNVAKPIYLMQNETFEAGLILQVVDKNQKNYQFW